MEYFLAFLSALPKILAIIQAIMVKVNNAEQRGLGRKEAVAEALTIAHRDLALADAAENEAIQSHREHPADDRAFDPEGERKD